MKFKIKWTEAHNLDNWDENNRENGIKKILDSYPYVEHWFDDDGWLDGTCEDFVEADTVKEAMEKAFDEFECEVFDVYDETGKLIGNEGGLMKHENR